MDVSKAQITDCSSRVGHATADVFGLARLSQLVLPGMPRQGFGPDVPSAKG